MTGRCYKHLKITERMLEKITSTDMYTAAEETDGGLDALFD